MNEVNTSRLARLRTRLRGMLPFAWGVTAALLALLFYNFLFPKNILSEREVNEAIAVALASATPRPAFSAEIYPLIAPSLVAVQTEDVNANGETGQSFGSGVIVNDDGSI